VLQLTHQNESILAALEMNAPETILVRWGRGNEGRAMLIRPPKLTRRKNTRYWWAARRAADDVGECVGIRWNVQFFSAAGYVTLMINRRGSTGYGQKFTDEITNNWADERTPT